MNTIDLTVAGDDEHHAAELTNGQWPSLQIDCNEAYITSVSLVLYISVGFPFDLLAWTWAASKLNLHSVTEEKPSGKQWFQGISPKSCIYLPHQILPNTTKYCPNKYCKILPHQIWVLHLCIYAPMYRCAGPIRNVCGSATSTWSHSAARGDHQASGPSFASQLMQKQSTFICRESAGEEEPEPKS